MASRGFSINKYLFVVLALMIIKTTVTGSKNETKLHIDRRFYHLPIYINICDIEDRRSKVHCYCDSNKPNQATRADCWIFSGGITEDDPIWPSFSSQPDIEHLMFNVRSDDALTFVPAKAIIRLDKLKHLTIQFGTIKRIPAFAFTNSSTIRQMFLKSNKITDLEKQSFSQMAMLSNLSLDDNQISELKRDVFYGLPNLHVLHLSNNNLSLLHEGCFKHLINLIELKLDFNYISVVTKEMLEGLENLLRLNLRNNKLTMIGNLAFSESWGLKELMLDNNAIEYISDRAFGGLTQLQKLTLSGNKLSIFYEDVLEDMRNLEILDLRNNLLATISYETIRPVLDNEKGYSVAVYLEGNPFVCNCRLAWVYLLRNTTKDEHIKQALEKITCIDLVVESINELDTDKMDNIQADNNYEYEEKNDIDVEKEKEVKNTAVKLLDIPVDQLYCPKELRNDVEESYGHPVQNEIKLKAFSNVSGNSCSVMFILLSFVLF